MASISRKKIVKSKTAEQKAAIKAHAEELVAETERLAIRAGWTEWAGADFLSALDEGGLDDVTVKMASELATYIRAYQPEMWDGLMTHIIKLHSEGVNIPGQPQVTVEESEPVDLGDDPWAPVQVRQPVAQTQQAPTVRFDPNTLDVGPYMLNGEVFQVKKSNQSGNNYAKAFVPPASKGDNATFIYRRGAVFNLRPEHKMTVEEAEKVGAQFGVCAWCGRTLTDPKSVARSIGPVCFKRFATAPLGTVNP